MRLFFLILYKLKKLTGKLGNRWRSAYYAHIFSSCGRKRPRIARQVVFSYPQNIACGEALIVNPQVYFAAKGGIELGDNVTISAGAKILSSSLQAVDGAVSRKHIHKKVTIGSNVWLGAGCIICPGVTIGDNVIVAAGAIVTKDLPGDHIYAGIPAKMLRPLAEKNPENL